jgi:hypothetical protein
MKYAHAFVDIELLPQKGLLRCDSRRSCYVCLGHINTYESIDSTASHRADHRRVSCHAGLSLGRCRARNRTVCAPSAECARSVAARSSA